MTFCDPGNAPQEGMHPTRTCSTKTKHHLGRFFCSTCWVQPKRQYLDKLIFQVCPPQTGQSSVVVGLSWAVRGWRSSHSSASFRWVAEASAPCSKRRCLNSQFVLWGTAGTAPLCLNNGCAWARERVTCTDRHPDGGRSLRPLLHRILHNPSEENWQICTFLSSLLFLPPPYPVTCMLEHYPEKWDDEEQARSKQCIN